MRAGSRDVAVISSIRMGAVSVSRDNSNKTEILYAPAF
jgi:hypothetical protein